ncbi:MAG: DNA (cytosine-5-)-methyltransferase [Methanobrevibacter sp.]|nr:DNA (cytosine-5-)-methyltransferase [Methanobrevibacter sp.]
MSQQTISIIELFAGIGAQVAALKRLGVDYKTTGISEIDKYAIQSYEAINGPTFNYGDITKIPMLDYADLWTYSFPCFTADSLVLTERNGYKQIADIQIGESVLTHDGNFKTVENVINNGVKPTVKIYGMGFDEIHTTENHKFYVREKARVWNNLRRSYDRVFSKPVWKQAVNLTRNDYLGFPVNKKSIIPEWNGITFVWSDGRSDRHKNEISKYLENDNFWWLIGRYVADGYIRNNGGVILSCGKKKITEFKAVANELGINYSLSEDRTAYKFHYSLKELELFVKSFGKYAFGKKIPSFIIDLPVKQLKAFLDGYMAGDGCFTNKKFKATSVSRELIYGLAQCVAKVYKRPFSIYKTKRAKTTVIESRIVNQRDTYELTFNKENHIQDKAFYENGYVWYPFNKIEKAENEVVYDLTVSDNHSFVVNNAIVHNCQDLSVAGKQAGISEGTRSGLLLHVERLLETAVLLGNQPKYLLLENVKALVSKKFKPDFDRWLQKLESLGYNNYWQVLNAKDYGVPQNRERVFVVSIRKDVDTKGYKFPEKIPLTRKLKDVLEPVVDEKYYLAQEKVDKLIKSTFHQERDRIQDENSVCQTLLARDYKDPKCIGNIYGLDSHGGFGGDVFDTNGVSRTLMADGGNRTPYITEPLHIKEATKQGYSKAYEGDSINFDQPNSTTRRGRVGHQMANTLMCSCNQAVVQQVGNIVNTGNWDNPQRGRIYSPQGCSPALNTMQGGGLEPKILKDYRIRKLTPLECWRLMDFTDEEFYAAQLSGVSNSQLYKCAGNSIVVAVLQAIFKELLA